jgi:hypothetical protein
MGALRRCWRCDEPFRPSYRDEPICSRECAKEWRRAWYAPMRRRRERPCVACARPINPQARADARFCSAKCRQRVFRHVRNTEHFEATRELVADDFRELDEAWRRARKSNRCGYADTPLADRLREEMQRIEAAFDRRDYRACAQCGTHVSMRKSQRYCSASCRVKAHRASS